MATATKREIARWIGQQDETRAVLMPTEAGYCLSITRPGKTSSERYAQAPDESSAIAAAERHMRDMLPITMIRELFIARSDQPIEVKPDGAVLLSGKIVGFVLPGDNPLAPWDAIGRDSKLIDTFPTREAAIAALADASPAPRQPMLATCRACTHVWPVLWLPCSMDLIAQAGSAAKFCPMCGNAEKGNVQVASRAAGDLYRYAAWARAEAERATKDAKAGHDEVEGSR